MKKLSLISMVAGLILVLAAQAAQQVDLMKAEVNKASVPMELVISTNDVDRI